MKKHFPNLIASFLLGAACLLASILFAAVPYSHGSEGGSNSLPRSISFDELDELIKNQNAKVKERKFEKNSLESRTGYLGRSFLPKVDAQGGVESFETGFYTNREEPFYGVTAKLNLFNGFKDKAQNDLFNSRALAAKHALQNSQNQEILKAKFDFIDIHFLNKQIELLDEAIKLNNKNKGQAEVRIKRGLTTKSDRLNFKLFENFVSILRKEIEHQKEESEHSLKLALGFLHQTSLKIEPLPESAFHLSKNRNLKAPDALPALQQIEANKNSAKFEHSINKSWWTPSVEVYATHNLYTLRNREFLNRDHRDETVFGAKVTIPLFDGLEGASKSSEKFYREKALEVKRENLLRRIKTDFVEFEEHLKTLDTSIKVQQESVKLSNNYLELSLDEYRKGVKNGPDILSASRQLLDQNFDLIGLQKKFLKTKIKYELITVQN